MPFQCKALTDDRDNLYAIALVTAFFLGNAFVLNSHEMWRDEIQAWLLARDSTSIFDLFRNLRYEGHPALWHLCLMPLTRVFNSVVAVQVLHLLIASSAVYVFAEYSPFSRVVKLLFVFGYFPFYEYSVISRNYSLGLLLVFIFCALFERRHTHFIRIGIVLFFLCHTNVLSLLLVIVIFGVLLLEYLLLQDQPAPSERAAPVRVWLGFAVILLGITTAILQIIPPVDSALAVGWTWTPQWNVLRRIITSAYFPLPSLQLHFWGSTIWGGNYASPFFSIAALGFVLLFAWRTARKPVALAIFVGGTLALLAFYNAKYTGAIRHHGYLYIVFIASAWISKYCAEWRWFPKVASFNNASNKVFHYFFMLILVIHVAGSVVASAFDIKYQFSCAEQASKYIKENNLSNMLIVCYPDTMASTVVGYLGKDAVYYPNRSAFGSFIRLDTSRSKISVRQAVEQAYTLGSQCKQDVLLLFTTPLGAADISLYTAEFLTSFTNSIVRDEDYYLYILRRPQQNALAEQ